MSAETDAKKSTCSLPGESDCAKSATVMSKSNCLTRYSYWAASTVRTRAVTPSRSRFFTNGRVMRSKFGSSRRISNSMGRPVSTFTSRRLRTTQPACFRSASARTTLGRIPPDAVEGGWYSRVNTSSGIRPRSGSRTASSAAPGSPREASSELEK